MIRTKIDDMLELLKEKKTATLGEISKQLDWHIVYVEKACQALERSRMVALHYPIFERAWVQLRTLPEEEKEILPTGKLVEKYPIEGFEGHINAEVRIANDSEDDQDHYFVMIPRVSRATAAYFKEMENDVIRLSPVSEAEKTGDEKKLELTERHKIISGLIAKELGPEKKDLEPLCGTLLIEMFGLGDIEVLLADRMLEEVVINSSKQTIAIYHKKYGWMKTNLLIPTETEVENYAAQIARKVGKQISTLNPLLDAHLLSGDRVNATLFPISSIGNTITLRMFARNPWTITTFLSEEHGAMNYEMAALLWQATHYEMNIMVGGGTASGKTSLLNGIVALIPPKQRIISIEDTRELNLPKYQWNWVPLTTRSPNPEGLGEVTMLDLVVNSLRMRPDRIIMGEIRRKKEAEVLFEAMHTGHSVYATMHADTGSQLLKRLIEPPIEVPKSQIEDIHLVAVQYRDRRKNIRKLLEIGEASVNANGEPELKRIYLWRSRSGKFDMVSKPNRYLEQLNIHTGMTEKETNEDLDNKKKVLEWMVKNKLERVEDVGRVMYNYYLDEASVVQAAEKMLAPDKILQVK